MSEKRVSGADSPLVIDNSSSGCDDKETAESVRKQDSNWEPYEGPRGGSGWRNTETGEVVYDDDFSPGDENESENVDESQSTPADYESKIKDSIDIEERSPTAYLTKRQVTDTLSADLSRAKNSNVADNTVDEIQSVRSRGGVSMWNGSNGEMLISPNAFQSTVSHELGHAMVKANGYDTSDFASLVSMSFSRDSGIDESLVGKTKGEVIDEREESGDISSELADKFRNSLDTDDTVEVDDLSFNIDNEFEGEREDEFSEMVEQINSTLSDVIEDIQYDGDPVESITRKDYEPIKDEYEWTNANEFFAAIHENLQQEGINRNNIETIYKQYPEVLDTYFDVFEPNDLQKRELNQLFNESGGSGPIESVPFPEVQE